MEPLDQENDAHKPKPVYRVVHTSIEILVFMVLVILTTLLLQPLQEIMKNRMTELRDSLLTRLEAVLGRNIRYDTLGPSLFGTLDIRNIRIYGKDGKNGEDEIPVITIARVRVSYSLLDLIFRGIPQAIRSVRLDRPVIAVDMQRDADLLGLFSGLTAGGGASVNLATVLHENVRLQVRNGSCEIRSETGSFSLERFVLEASLEQDTLRFQGTWDGAAALNSPFAQLPEPLSAQVSGRLEGECTGDLQRGSAYLYLTAIAGAAGQAELFQIRPVTFTLSLEDQRIALTKIPDEVPFDFAADYDFRLNRISGAFRCEGFSPEELVTIEGPWKDYARWLRLSTSGSASFALDTGGGTGATHYDLALSGAIPSDLLPMGGASFVLQGSGTGEELILTPLSLQFPQGELRYQGKFGFTPLALQGQVSMVNFSLSGTDAISADIQVATRNREIGFQGRDLRFGTVPLADVHGAILLEDQGLSFSASLLRSGDRETEGEAAEADTPGQLSLEGFLDYQPRYGEIHLVVDALAVADIVAMVRPLQTLPEASDRAVQVVSTLGSSLLTPIRISTEVFLATDFEQRFSYHAPRFLVTAEDQGTIFTGIIDGTNRRFACTEGQINLTTDPIILSGYADMKSLEDISFSLNAAYQDRPYQLEGMILDRHSLSIQGSYGLRAYISMTDRGGYSGYIAAENIPVPYQGQFARLSLMSSLRYDTLDFWYFDLDHLELADLNTPLAPRIALRAAGRADQQGAFFPELLIDDGRGALKGNLDMHWDPRFSDISGNLVMGTDTGEERYDLEAQFKDKQLYLHVLGSNMQFLRFVPHAFDAVASGEFSVFWDSADSFFGELQLSSLSAEIDDTELELSGAGTFTAEALDLQAVEVRYGAVQMQLPRLQVQLPEHRVEAQAQLQLLYPAREVDFACTLGIDFAPIASWFSIPEALNTFTGVMQVERARFNTLQPEEPFDLVFSRTNSLMVLSGGPQDMIRVQLSDTGDLYAGLSYPSPVRGTMVGTIGAKTIEAQIPDLYVDLSALWDLIPAEAQELITISEGFVTASLQVSGSLGDPDFFGLVQGHGIRLGVPQYVAADIQPVPITVVLAGNEMTFGPIPAAVGSGQGTITGSFLFDRWIPNTFTLNIQVPPESPIPFGLDILGIVAQGNTSGNLILSMKDLVFSIQGDMAAQDTEITLNTEKLAAGAERMTRDGLNISFVTDITIHAGRKVEFIWPAKEFPILQTYADQGASIRIESDSGTSHYSLTGDVNLRGGEIFYFERSFYIREGQLSFNENELQFDPKISARAEVRDQTNDEGPVTIAMIIDNAPLQSFTARFESTPPLSQIAIFSMLGQSMTGTPTEAGNPTVPYAFLASTADILAQTQVLRHFQRRIRDFLGLDMFSFRTQILQNMAYQLVRRQDDTNSSVFGNSFDNTAVFLGKYIGPDVFLQLITALRYDEHRSNVEVFPAQGLRIGGFTIEPEFGMELRGPLCDIRVNIVPRHVETMFINDISCTLTWRRSMYSLGDLFKG